MSLSVLTAAQEQPERPALLDASRVWTYAELAEALRSEIARLRSAGLNLPGAPRAARVTTRLDAPTVISVLALIELGIPFVPLHAKAGDDERARVEALTGPLFEATPRPASETCCPGPLPRVADDGAPLALVPTSGSTGQPRLVELSRGAFAAAARAGAAHLGWNDEERWLLALPLAHVGGLSILTRCLHGRGSVAIAHGTSAEDLAASFAQHRPTLASLVPTMLERLLAHDAHWSTPASTRAVLVGGAAAPRALVERALERGMPLLLTYGMTETCAQVATARPGEDPRRLHPLPGVTLREGTESIEIRAPMLATRVLPREEDARAWTDDGWLRTRDAGRVLEDGSIEILGRIDDLIVSGGEKIAPRDVEEALRACPGVADAMVFALHDEVWGARVAAALVSESDKPPGDDDLRDALAARLARYKHPRAVAWFPRFPLNEVGKVDRPKVIEDARSRLRPL